MVRQATPDWLNQAVKIIDTIVKPCRQEIQMRLKLQAALLALALTGCAVNDRLGLQHGEPHRNVMIDGVSFSVVESPKGTWQAVHTDFFANNTVVHPDQFLPRKVQFTRAIEEVSACKVSDSVMDFAASKLQATVKC
jgi:hypothetical protein